MVANKSPDVDSFCLKLGTLTSLPVIRLPGGAQISAAVDPTKGVPSECSLSLDLVGKLEAALAPFGAIFTILDAIAQLGTCFQLLVSALTDPLKIPDLLKCVPDLLPKLNAILALIPIFPQGIAQAITSFVDILRTVAFQLKCVVKMLENVRDDLAEAQRAIDAAATAEDPVLRDNLLHLAGCAKANAEKTSGNALAALGPINRILCTVRGLLVLTGLPPLVDIAKKLTLTLPANLPVIDDIIGALDTISTDILLAVDALVEIGGPFGAPLPPPDIIFKCPIDELAEEEASSPPPVPHIASLTPGTVIAGAPSTNILVGGTNFTSAATVYTGSTPLETKYQGSSLVVTLPAELLAVAGSFSLVVINVSPTGGTSTIPTAAVTAPKFRDVPKPIVVGLPSFKGLQNPSDGKQTAESTTSNSVTFTVT